MMSGNLRRLVGATLSANADRIRAAALSGGDAGELVPEMVGVLTARYIAYRSAGRKSLPRDLEERYAAELREAEAMVASEVGRMVSETLRARRVALLEHPLLELKVEAEMRRRGIPYMFRCAGDENVLTVQITGEWFFDIPLRVETADRTLGLVKYFINRPDCAAEEEPLIRKRRSYYLTRAWDKCSRKA